MEPQQRHGCLTAWIVVMIAITVVSLITTPLTFSATQQHFPRYSVLGAAVIVLCSLLRLASAVALWQWKRWGFYGIVAADVAAVASNAYLGLGIGQSIAALAGIALLYWVLNMGDYKAWDYLT